MSKHLIRKIHRYLGVIIGIQFFLWTLGGFYFSWNDINKVRGDHLRTHTPYLNSNIKLASLDKVLKDLNTAERIDSIVEINVINILGSPVYRISYVSSELSKGDNLITVLVDGTSGKQRSEVTEQEARMIAKAIFIPRCEISSVEYLKEVGKHNEYRNKPLPAWAVSFEHKAHPIIYIGAQTGTFESIRYNTWRNFDFLWMLHTMDYSGRDNFGNILLKSFSILGLITIMSGFLLFFVSSPSIRKFKKTWNRS